MSLTQITTNESTGNIPTMGFKEIQTTGDVYYVDSNTGDDSNNGLTAGSAMATLAAAASLTTANKGDVILLMPGHAETLIANTELSTEGVTILGLGLGDNRPVFTFGTATTADIEIKADNVRISNCIFKCDIDSQAAVIETIKAYTTIDDCEFWTGSAKQYLIGINLSNANSDHAKILHCTFIQRAAGATAAIEIGAALDNLEIALCKIYGNWSEAAIHNPTANTATNLDIHHNVIENLDTGDWAIELVSACTGSIRHNDLYADTLTAILDPGSCLCYGNEASVGTDRASVEIPTTEVEGGNLVVKATATLPQTGDGTLFTITGGQVEILQLLGEVTTVIESKATVCKLKLNCAGTGSDVNLCADLDLNADAVGTLYSITGNPNDPMQDGLWLVAGLSQPILIGPGVIEMEADSSATGSIGWFVLYRALEPGAKIA